MFLMEEIKKRSQQSLDNELRDDLCVEIMELLNKKYGEVYKVGATNTGTAYRLASPCVDSEQNEKTILVAISIPRGSKEGEPYDLYEAAADYEYRVKVAEEAAKAKEEKRAREEAEKERKRQARIAKKSKKHSEE